MLISGIKSKPIYEPLRADPSGRYHLLLARGPGGGALLRVLGELQAAAPDSLQRTRVLLLPDEASAMNLIGRFDELRLGEIRVFDEVAALLTGFRSILEQSLMGTRLYVAGPESFIGVALRTALEFDLKRDEIRAEAMGTLARRVYCVHCRVTTEDVRTNIVRCAGCQRWLLVRDHYSRRFAAYMGVMADAEAPGELPPIHEIYA